MKPQLDYQHWPLGACDQLKQTDSMLKKRRVSRTQGAHHYLRHVGNRVATKSAWVKQVKEKDPEQNRKAANHSSLPSLKTGRL